MCVIQTNDAASVIFFHKILLQCRGDVFVAALPELDASCSVEELARDAEVVQKLDVAVNDWSKGVKRILDTELEIALYGVERDLSVGPETVLDFWSRRVRDLTNIGACACTTSVAHLKIRFLGGDIGVQWV